MERYVLEALQKAVIQAVAPTSLPVKYLGRTFEIDSTDKWVEVVYIPNNIENQYWDDSKTFRGVMRLVLHWPVDDAGVYSALDIASDISDGFLKGSKFSDTGVNVTVMVTEEPNVEGVMEQAPEILIPITVRYSYFKA